MIVYVFYVVFMIIIYDFKKFEKWNVIGYDVFTFFCFVFFQCLFDFL